MDGTWLPVIPGGDAALAVAIAHVWITEDTYDKDYVAKRTVGFEEFKPCQIRWNILGTPTEI
jgi:trimethylamine-N-oxide reductase (cytochrome c)